MNTLTKPGIFVLTFFGLFTVAAILYVFYRISLPFMNFFGPQVFIYVVTPLITFLLVTFYLDNHFKTKLKRYSILAAVLFIVCLLAFESVKDLIIKNTESRAQKLVEAIKTYKEINGFWPQSLNDPYFNKYSKSAIVQRPFYYRLEKDNSGDTSFIFSFYSFDGFQARFQSNSTKIRVEPIIWRYSD